MAHLFVRVMESLDYKPDDLEAAIRRVQHVEYGLSAQVEFAAIAAWLGRCRSVHELEQPDFVSPGLGGQLQVPDLLAILHDKGQTRPVLFEVKTTEIRSAKGAVIPMKKEYLAALQAYAQGTGIPLLIAWKPRPLGFWIVFDPTIVPIQDEEIRLEDAIKEDLMSALLGDAHIVCTEGSGLTFRLVPVGPREQDEDGFTQSCNIAGMFWHTADGSESKLPAEGVVTVLLASAEYRQSVSEQEIRQSWICTGATVRAQEALRFSVGWAIPHGKRIHWQHVGEQLDHILKRDSLMKDLQSSVGSFTRFIFHQVPQTWPAWVPDAWKT